MSSPRTGTIRLYDGIGEAWFPIGTVKGHLEQWLPWHCIEMRNDLPVWSLERVRDDDLRRTKTDDLARRLSGIRVLNPAKEARRRRPLGPELDYETRLLSGDARATPGVVYDGNDLQRIAFGMLPPEERGLDAIHIWFTTRLFATWDENDRRYHARVSVYGYPSIISTSGMAVAPARDRQYYLAQRLGVPVDGPGASASDDYLEHDDPRDAEVAKGYAMQAVFYALAGDPYCDDPHCRLFNGHWQREILEAQLGGTDYCARHKEMIEAWHTSPSLRTTGVER
jgi:hypothetical protein